MNNFKYRKHEKGQTLLFVVVAVTIALAVGVSVSTRTLSSLKRVSRSNTSERATAAAEGGIEFLLSKTYKQLNSATNPTSLPNCQGLGGNGIGYDGGKCIYDLGGSGDMASRAILTVGTFVSNNSSNGYTFSLQPDSVKEVNLNGFSGTINVCWSNPNAAIYYIMYNKDGLVEKKGFYKSGFTNASNLANITGVSGDCTSVVTSSWANPKPYGIRIRVLYDQSQVSVNPVSGNLPNQGYKLTSQGVVLSKGTNTSQPETSTITVYKSLPYVSGIFDFGIYENDDLGTD